MPDIPTMGDVTVDVKEGSEVTQVVQEKKEMVINCKMKKGVACIDIAYKDFAYVDEEGMATKEITGLGYVQVKLNEDGLGRLIEDLTALLVDEHQGTISDVEIRDRALSADEIAETYKCTDEEE